MAAPSAPHPHRSLNAVAEFLEAFQPPSGAFDPSGTWEHRYAIWLLLPKQRNLATKPMGALQLRRKPAAGREFQLSVEQSAIQQDRTVYHAKAGIRCAADRLATPRQWELETAILERSGQTVKDTAIRRTGRVAGGKIIFEGRAQRSIAAPKQFTSNWSLFDALQRSPDKHSEALTFDLFEELELLKPKHTLKYRLSTDLKLVGRKVRLHCYEEIGEGILPYAWWLDDQHRVVMAIGALRAFLWDPEARAMPA